MSRWDLCQICVIKRAGNGIFEVENVKECHFSSCGTPSRFMHSHIASNFGCKFPAQSPLFFSSDSVFGDPAWQEPQCCLG